MSKRNHSKDNYLNFDIAQVAEQTKCSKEPDNYCDNDYDVQYVLDFCVHRDVGIYQPKQYPNNYQSYNN